MMSAKPVISKNVCFIYWKYSFILIKLTQPKIHAKTVPTTRTILNV